MENLQSYFETYGDYIEEIRQRLYRVLIVFCVIFTTGFFSTTWLVKIFVGFFTFKDANIVATSPFQLFDLAMSIGFFCAIIITLPYSIWQAYAFLRPGLLQKERGLFLLLIPVAIFLFLTGFSYGFAILYYSLGIIATVNTSLGIVNLWDISQFISLIMLTSVLLGVLFEFPLLLTFLIRMGVVTTDFLASKRRHAIVVILIFVILLPPTDGLSDIIITAPLLLIYELTILLNSSYSRKNALDI